MITRSHLRSVMLTGFLLAGANCFGQPEVISNNSKSNNFSVGLTAGHYQYDPTLGIEITSPEIFIDDLHFRLKGNRSWLEQYKTATNNWGTFNSYLIGLVYNTNVVERGRIFFEAGAYIISPNKVFSSKKLHAGYYGSVGVELFVAANPNQRFSYFFAGGLTSIHAHADKLEGRPAYGSGITFINGLRWYLSSR